MEEDQELQNPFPSPPSHYVNYTSHNLHLLSLFKSRLEEANENIEDINITKRQHELLAENQDVPDWPLTQLDKPRIDWILEEGEYTVFGETWPTSERIASLGQLGGTQLYPEDPTDDRRPALQSILSTLLYTYSNFLSSIIAPPNSVNEDLPPDWERLLEWMRVMGQNLIGAANDLRPVQARANLETMMARQLELRRQETKAIHTRCDYLEAKLSSLRQQLEASMVLSSGNLNVEGSSPSSKKPPENGMNVDEVTSDSAPHVARKIFNEDADVDLCKISIPHISEEDMFRWAEEVHEQG